VVLATIKTADDGEDDDGKEGDNDATEESSVSRAFISMFLSLPATSICWVVVQKRDRKEELSQDIPRPCLHRPNDRLHDGGYVASKCCLSMSRSLSMVVAEGPDRDVDDVSSRLGCRRVD
jgi:hypothetical protein